LNTVFVVDSSNDQVPAPHHRRFCACLPRGFLGVPVAIVCAIVASALSAVATSGTGDVFWGGWDGAASSKSSHASTTFRLTLFHLNSCSLGDDTFCTDFFADKSVSISFLPGGAQLAAAATPVRAYFGGVLAAGLLALVRAIYASARGCARGAASANEASSLRRWNATAFSCAVLHALSAVAGAQALSVYQAATSHFIAVQNISGFELVGGFVCGAVCVSFHAIAALIWLGARLKPLCRRCQ
jgi:hypothetical protein